MKIGNPCNIARKSGPAQTPSRFDALCHWARLLHGASNREGVWPSLNHLRQLRPLCRRTNAANYFADESEHTRVFNVVQRCVQSRRQSILPLSSLLLKGAWALYLFMSSKPKTFEASSPTPSRVESVPAPSQPKRTLLDRFPTWVSTNIRSKQSRKLLLRCWLASWAAFVIMLPNTMLRTLGNACVSLSPILRADRLYHLVSWHGRRE